MKEEIIELIDYLIEIRSVARKYGYYELADRIRDDLLEFRIRLMDTRG